jgi:hypothetical protein
MMFKPKVVILFTLILLVYGNQMANFCQSLSANIGANNVRKIVSITKYVVQNLLGIYETEDYKVLIKLVEENLRSQKRISEYVESCFNNLQNCHFVCL